MDWLPLGVAMGVWGAAQIGQLPCSHCQTPPSHRMTSLQSGPHEAPGTLQGDPACGIVDGHPAGGDSQYHCGGSIVWQTGYSLPPLHGLHQQRLPSEYQQDNDASGHGVPSDTGAPGHDAGRGGWLVQAASGFVTVHEPSSHLAVVRHWGRGSSPQLQCAPAHSDPLEDQGGLQLLAFDGGAGGHAEPALPACPPTPAAPAAPPVPAVPPAPPVPPSVTELEPSETVDPPHPAAQAAATSASVRRPDTPKLDNPLTEGLLAMRVRMITAFPAAGGFDAICGAPGP